MRRVCPFTLRANPGELPNAVAHFARLSRTIELQEGDALIIEPGEAHTFLASSESCLHFVIHAPGLAGEQARLEKQLVPRARLGL